MTILILLGLLLGVILYMTAAVGAFLRLVIEVETKKEITGPTKKPKNLPKSVSAVRQVFAQHARLFPNSQSRTIMLLLAAFPVLGFLFGTLFLVLWLRAL